MPDMPAIAVLGRKLDSIPFSPYHIAVILVLGLVGFTDGYDLALTGSLLVLAKGPLHITPDQIRWLTVAATMFVVVGGFISAAISDHVSRKTIIQIGVVGMTFFTLLIPFVQTAEQLIVVRLLTGVGLGFAITAPFPVAAELMPAQHRRTYGAIYEICLASAFALLPLVAGFLAGSDNGFRWIALPGGLALFIVPILVHLVIPQSARWQLRHGRIQEAVATVNQYIRRCGDKVALSAERSRSSAQNLPPSSAASNCSPFQSWRCFAPGQLRFTVVGILTAMSAGTAYYLDRDPVAEGVGRTGRRSLDRVRDHDDRFPVDDPRQSVQRAFDGALGAALVDRLCAVQCLPRAEPDGNRYILAAMYAGLMMMTGVPSSSASLRWSSFHHRVAGLSAIGAVPDRDCAAAAMSSARRSGASSLRRCWRHS